MLSVTYWYLVYMLSEFIIEIRFIKDYTRRIN